MDHPIRRYLEDAIAAEKSFETQLNTFAEEATLPDAARLFEQHALETKQQYEDLTARLERLGGSTSTLKGILAHLFNAAPKLAQLSQDEQDRSTQDLMMAFAVENAEVAMYESLAISAETAGDPETASLARRIQLEEKATAEGIWKLISESAVQTFLKARSESEADAQSIIVRHLQNTEAAERNFEDALATFSKSGKQGEVQSLLSMMSKKARTQHERLAARLTELGGTTSTAKSVLAHLLAFTPVSAQLGHDEAEKSTQHLMITYSAAAAEMAMYEALAIVATEAGDETTARLARELQAEEEDDHRLAWEHLPNSARSSYQEVRAAA
jgi:ferritin-like metal-binding protein YciE